jgi:hypothetical protein
MNAPPMFRVGSDQPVCVATISAQRQRHRVLGDRAGGSVDDTSIASSDGGVATCQTISMSVSRTARRRPAGPSDPELRLSAITRCRRRTASSATSARDERG